MGCKIGPSSILTSMLAVPLDSVSGKTTLHLHKMSYGSNSLLKKQILLPLATLCATPLTASIDICLRTIRWISQPTPRDQLSHYLCDLTSHIVSVAALPVRLIYYYCTPDQDAFFSLRHPSSNAQQVLISMQESSADPEWEKDESLADVEIVDPPLLNDIPSTPYFDQLPNCVERGGNQALDEKTRQKYCEDALNYFEIVCSTFGDSSSVSIDDPLPWLDIAVSSGQIALIQRILAASPIRLKEIVCKALMRSVEKIAEKALEGEGNYSQILQEIFTNTSDDETTFSQARCDAFFEQWLDNPRCLSSLNLLQPLLGKSYRPNDRVPTSYFHLAMKHRSPQFIERLFKPFHVDMNELDFNDLSLLEQALLSKENQLELVELLCQKGVIVNRRFIGNPPLILENTSLTGHTALTYAVSIGDRELVEVLNRYTAVKNPTSEHTSYPGKTVRRIAFESGAIDLLEVLGLLTPRERLAWSTRQDKPAPSFEKAEASRPQKKPAPPSEKAATFTPVAQAHRDPPTEFTKPFTNAETRVLELFKNPSLLTKKAELTVALTKLRNVHEHKNLWLAFTPEMAVSKETLKAAFRKLLLQIHPDKNPAEKIIAEKIFHVFSAIKDELIEFIEAQ